MQTDPPASPDGYVTRALQTPVEEALADTRVVAIVGPRQAGKSTLAAHVAAQRPGSTLTTLDDQEQQAAARADPRGFVEGRPGLLVIDEVQRVPELLLAVKATVDQDPRPGRFLLTGSAQLLAARAVQDTLAGRIELLELRLGRREREDPAVADEEHVVLREVAGVGLGRQRAVGQPPDERVVRRGVPGVGRAVAEELRRARDRRADPAVGVVFSQRSPPAQRASIRGPGTLVALLLGRTRRRGASRHRPFSQRPPEWHRSCLRSQEQHRQGR